MLRNTFGLVICFVAIGFATYSLSAEEAPRLAKVIQVKQDDGTVERRFFGRVVAKETVDLAFQVGGQIVEFPAIEGSEINVGGLIAKLDLEPFELVLGNAKLRLEQAERTLERYSKLQGSSVTRVTVEDTTTERDLAKINVRDAERSLREARLIAPFKALVASRKTANFTTISPGVPVVRLHDMSELRIEIDVPEVLFQRNTNDDEIELWAEFPASDERFRLEPREYNAETSAVGQTFSITLGLTPPEGLRILPGSSATVFARLRGQPNSMSIPASAVVTSADGATGVMTFSPSEDDLGTVKLAPVEIISRTDGSTAIIDGLADGAEIVASGAASLTDGETVRRFSGFKN